MQIAMHQIQAIRASLVAAMEQLDGLQMVMDAQAAPPPPQVEDPEVARRDAIMSRPTFGRAKEPAASPGDR